MATYTIPSSIAADGSKEASSDLINFIGSCSGTSWSWNEIVFPSGAQYRTDYKVELMQLNHVRWRNNKAVFVRKPNPYDGTQGPALDASHLRSNAHLVLRDCRAMLLDGFRVQGCADPTVGYVASLEAQAGIWIAGGSDIEISDYTARDVWGDKIYVAPSAASTPMNIHLHDGGEYNAISHRDGMACPAVFTFNTERYEFGYCARTGTDLEGNSPLNTVNGLVLSECHWTYHRLNWLAASSGWGGTVDGVGLYFNRTESALGVAVGGVGKRANFDIVSNTAASVAGNPSGAAMNFTNFSGNLNIVNNVQPLQPGRTPPMRVARWDLSTAQNATITYTGNTPDLG